MAQIKSLEQMVAESQATVEQMREDFRIAEKERQVRMAELERQRKIEDDERQVRMAELERQRKIEDDERQVRMAELERQRKIEDDERHARALEREVYIEKMRAETKKSETDSKYLMWIPIIVSFISSITAIIIAIFK